MLTLTHTYTHTLTYSHRHTHNTLIYTHTHTHVCVRIPRACQFAGHVRVLGAPEAGPAEQEPPRVQRKNGQAAALLREASTSTDRSCDAGSEHEAERETAALWEQQEAGSTLDLMVFQTLSCHLLAVGAGGLESLSQAPYPVAEPEAEREDGVGPALHPSMMCSNPTHSQELPLAACLIRCASSTLVEIIGYQGWYFCF